MENTILDKVENLVDGVEGAAVDLVARLSPWLAPLPTAYLTATATVKHLDWPTVVGVVAGVVVEALGLASVATALMLREYNANRHRVPDDWQPVDARGRRKRYRGKVDPPAPFKLAVALAGVYFVSVTGLTVVLDTLPNLAAFAPIIFPILSLAGVTVLALRADHKRRLAAIAERDASKSTRQGERQGTVRGMSSKLSNIRDFDANLDSLQAGRKAKLDARLDTLLTFYSHNPEAGATEASQAIGVSRQTVYTYLDKLETAGRIVRNNGTVKVQEV